MDKRRLRFSLYIPVLFILMIWTVKLAEHVFNIELHAWGIYPRDVDGLLGILTSPFVHGDFNHLINNTTPLFVLSVTLFFFYRGVSVQVFFLVYLITGMLVWIIARPAYHIGASGLIYGYASFLFFSGILRKHIGLIAISLLVVFMYGGMVWYVLPIKEGISWEAHMMGALTGFILSHVFKNKGPQRKRLTWEDEKEDNDDDIPPEKRFWEIKDDNGNMIIP